MLFKKNFLKNTWDKKVKVISLKLKTRMVEFNISIQNVEDKIKEFWKTTKNSNIKKFLNKNVSSLIQEVHHPTKNNYRKKN